MRYADLACGAGGLGLGLKRAGLSCGGAWDIDEAAVETYSANVSRNAEVADIRDLSLERDDLDILASGLPCESFSTLGRMDPRDPRGRLWVHFARLLAEAMPTSFVIENVLPFFRSRRFALLLGRAEALGYSTAWFVLDARTFGVAQARQRGFAIGSLNGLAEFNDWRPARIASVRDAIGDLPLVPDGRNDHVGYAHRPESVERYARIPPGGDWRDLPRDMMNPCWRRVNHGARSVLGRLRWDEPADTIRTTFLKPETGRHLHPEANRGLTLREGARLQGFDDEFRFRHGGLEARARLIGRAIPPPMAEAVGKVLREMG